MACRERCVSEKKQFHPELSVHEQYWNRFPGSCPLSPDSVLSCTAVNNANKTRMKMKVDLKLRAEGAEEMASMSSDKSPTRRIYQEVEVKKL